MVQKTNLIVVQLDRQEQYIRSENILIYGVEEDKDNDDGKKILFKIADELEIDLQKHLYGTSYWSTCKNPILMHLPLATLEMAIWKLSSRHLKNGAPSLHLMISSSRELILIINRWTVAKYLTSNSTTKILPFVNSEIKHSM